jgi:excisionase family DNA binding protein
MVIDVQLSVRMDESTANGLAGLICRGIENGNKELTKTLTTVVSALAKHETDDVAPGRSDIADVPRPEVGTRPPDLPVVQPMLENQPQLISTSEVAKMLGVSARTVYRLKDGGRLPMPVSIGSLVRWSRRSIEEWIEVGCPPIRRWKSEARR